MCIPHPLTPSPASFSFYREKFIRLERGKINERGWRPSPSGYFLNIKIRR
jgi:hypothetical protein